MIASYNLAYYPHNILDSLVFRPQRPPRDVALPCRVPHIPRYNIVYNTIISANLTVDLVTWIWMSLLLYFSLFVWFILFTFCCFYWGHKPRPASNRQTCCQCEREACMNRLVLSRSFSWCAMCWVRVERVWLTCSTSYDVSLPNVLAVTLVSSEPQPTLAGCLNSGGLNIEKAILFSWEINGFLSLIFKLKYSFNQNINISI